MAQTQVILLERVENLGQMGDVVAVRPGYARNFLLPQRKALRANKDNVAFFETQKKQLEATNIAKRSEAEKIATKAKDLFVNIIRQAAEGGQLYGSVNTRDIADAITAAGFTVDRAQVRINQSFKTIGLFAVDVYLHPEVKIVVTANIARSDEEAKIQKKTGKAMVATDPNEAKAAPVAATPEKGAFLDQAALDAETAAAAEADALAAAEEATRAEKSAKRATKKAAKKSDEPGAEGDEAEADTAE